MSTSNDDVLPPRHRLLQLDGLRGIAALSVVLFHYTTRFDLTFKHSEAMALSFPYGHLGVQLFFVISGFVIFMTLEHSKAPLDFLVSRISRLFPTYWTAVLMTWGLLALMALPGFQPSWTQVIANFSMTHELFGIESIDGVYWSLEIELIFYVWMLLLWVVGWLKRPVPVFCVWVIGAMLARFGATATGIWVPYGISHVLLFNWIAWFALGIAAYLRYRDGRATRGTILLACLALASIATTDGDLNLLPLGVVFLGAVVLASMSKASALDWTPLVWLGAISYPLYLVHDKIGWLTILRLEERGVAPIVAIVVAIVASLVAASILHLLVEKPATIALRRRYKRNRQEALGVPVGTTSSGRLPIRFSRWRWGAACVVTICVAVGGGSIGRLLKSSAPPQAGSVSINTWAGEDDAGSQKCMRLKAAGAQLVVVLGQSNAASHGEPDSAGPPAWVYYGGVCGQRHDPLPGTTGAGASIWPRLGQRLEGEAENLAPVVFAPIAVGGTRIAHWTSDGPVQAILQSGLEQIASSGLAVKAVVWQQGEADMLAGTDSSAYQAGLDALRKTLQRHSIDAPLYLAQSTYCRQLGSGAIRRSIQDYLAANTGRGFQPGPDTDRLLGEDRYDGCHFSRLGLWKAAALWAAVLEPALQRRPD
jgi:peptidoglycan/LPS O-acetylase OafA/YrhL